jgi:hypothetical protein
MELLLCVPVRVLDCQRSVVRGPSTIRFLIIASPARWFRGSTWPALGRVPYIPGTVSLPPVAATLLLLL